MRSGLTLAALVVCSLVLVPVGASAGEEPIWFQWVDQCEWAKYLATRDTPIVDWTGELIGENWRANWVRAAKYILYCAPDDDSVEKVKQAWYGSITLEGHVPDNGAPAKFGEPVWGSLSEEQYACSVLEDEFSGPSKPHEIVNGQYWLPPEWNFEYIDGRPLGELVRQSLANPFPDYNAAKGQLWNNPMFQAAVRLAYWVATHIPYNGLYNKHPEACYWGCASCCYYEGPAAVLLYPWHGWNCADHAVLAVALYRAAGIPGYVVGGLLDGGDHAWTAVFVYDPNSKDEKKWHEIFIDPVGPKAHECTHDPYCDYEYYEYEFTRWYRGRHPYRYSGRFPLAAELEDERILAGVNSWYWWRRVAAFDERGGWYASSGRINSEWDALKREWRTITVRPAPSKKSASIWPVIALTLLLIASRRPSS